MKPEGELAALVFYLIGASLMLLMWWWLFQYPRVFFKKRAQARLQALDAQKQACLDKASAHAQLVDEVVLAMRKPMQAVLQLNERLQQRNDLSPQVMTYLKQANDAVTHLQTIVNDLLDPIHNHTHGNIPLLRVTLLPSDVRTVVMQAFEWFALRCQQLGLSYRCQIDDDVPEQLLTDAHRLRH